jgi:acetyl esterase/lipase
LAAAGPGERHDVSLPLRIALAALSRPERHPYADDHPVQVADLHVPRGDGPFPVAVVVHGGYWQAAYGKLTTRPLAADLARRGWAAWNLEYRRLGRGQGGGWPATFDDVAAAIDHLAVLRDPRLDLGRVTVVGHSAGGQLALWAAARPGLPAGAPGAAPRVRPRDAVALAPVTDLAGAGRVAQVLLGGAPGAVPERFAQADPMRRLPLGLPLLVVHAADDATITVRRSRAYVAAARAAGDDATLLEPPAGGHRGVIDPGEGAWRSAAEWLATRT